LLGLIGSSEDDRMRALPVLRGTSLIEMLIVVSLLGIIAALATPAMQPTVAEFRVFSSTTAVASFIDDARRRAVAEGRCTRVRLTGGRLVTERRTGTDCVNLGTEGWTSAEITLGLEGPVRLTADALTVPASVTRDDHLIVFRPNGRLYGDGDLDTTDDGARIELKETAAQDHRAVVITAQGRVCMRNYGRTLPAIGDAGAVTCQ
jgi:prepilin-type N-terminal cleavage/methylation domain-containing protein